MEDISPLSVYFPSYINLPFDFGMGTCHVWCLLWRSGSVSTWESREVEAWDGAVAAVFETFLTGG